MKTIILRAAIIGLGMVAACGAASACVQGTNDLVGTYLHNTCPFAVRVSWCFGGGCQPGNPYSQMGPGQWLTLTQSPQQMRFRYCKVGVGC